MLPSFLLRLWPRLFRAVYAKTRFRIDVKQPQPLKPPRPWRLRGNLFLLDVGF